jgi:diguanylate cyclase (GGDEF)-like protein
MEAELEQQLPKAPAEGKSMTEYRLKLKKLQRRDWILWWASITVMLLLLLAVVSLSLPMLFRDEGSFFQFNLEQSVRALVGMVLLFNSYAIYQQIVVKRLHRQLAEQIEAAVKLETYAETMHRMAMLDPLTGLHNRRFAEERVTAEVARSHRSGHPLTIIMLDLNDFKQINDRYGHPAGDEVLKGFAERLKALVRVSDLAVRLGGDEFLIVLVDCEPDMAERLVSRIGSIKVPYQGKDLAVDFSAGWAGCRPGEPPEKLMERADQALYEAKKKMKAQTTPVTA